MTAMETIVEQAGGRLWFQLYMWADRALSHQLVERVKAAGFEALIVTVDGAVLPNREYNHRNGFSMPMKFGARMLDSSMAPIDVLPEILDAAGKRLTVMVDSGFRRGSDVVKALALGAQAVLVGRATLYGTAAGGEAGAARAIAILREEIDRVMALIGARGIADLCGDYLQINDGTARRGAGE